jgi:hypothetical protein
MLRHAIFLSLALPLLGYGEYPGSAEAPSRSRGREAGGPPRPQGQAPNAEGKHPPGPARAGQLLAGAAKVEITNKRALPTNDPLFVKALVLKNDVTTAAIITLDAVAVGEIGYIGNDYLGKVRTRIEKDLGIAPEHVMVNASHCHGVVCADVDDKTVEAVAKAAAKLVPVRIGVGVGYENRVSENRRLRLTSGKEADVRHAYSMPPDQEVTEAGPIDPQIGVLRLDRTDGRTVAVMYNFACHPIMGVPNGGNTADITGFASQVIEDNLGDGAVTLFVQGCAGDINPAGYKEVHQPRSAEPLGNMLGLSALKAVRKIQCVDDRRFTWLHETIKLPRADNAERIDALVAEQAKLLKALTGTTLNLKTFLELAVKYNLSNEFPSSYSHRYLHEKMIGKDDLSKLDEANRKSLQAYIENVHVMERLTRLQTNLDLLRKHQERNLTAGRRPLEVEMLAWRVGDFVLVTFPGELTVEIGLGIKERSPHKTTFVAGYTNGYIYYTPTAKQLRNAGGAQEDSDCMLAPAWEKLFNDKVAEMLKKLPRESP